MRRFSRRTVLASALTLPVAWAISCRLPEGVTIPREPAFQPLTVSTFEWTSAGNQGLTLPLVSSLIEQLTGKDTLRPAERLRAVMDNLASIEIVGSGRASALMIDESGIYLTAAHIFDGRTERTPAFEPSDSPAVVYHLVRGELAPVSSYIVDGEHDIAIFNAPRNAPPRAVSGLLANVTTVAPDQPAWMYPVIDESRRRATARLSRTRVDGTVAREEAPPQGIAGYADRMTIAGMIPFGGASGAPVVDKEGRLIGIESGFYPAGARTRTEYQGATVTRMRALVPLVQQGSVVRLQPAE